MVALATGRRLWHCARMDFTTTLICAGVTLAIAVVCGWRGARPPDLKAGPRLVPWRLLMVTAGAATVLLVLQAVRTSGLFPSDP